MNKKEYIAPEMVVEVLETEALMLTASNGTEYDTEGASFEQRGTERRGTWGNFWN